MKPLRYFLVDVFTNQPFGRNQLAVFPNASGLAACRREQSSSPTQPHSQARILHATGRSDHLLFRGRQNRGREGGPMTWKEVLALTLRPG
jgi:hypothetical protein